MKRKWYVPYLYIIPALLVLIVFRFIPVIYAFIISFFDWGMAGPQKFVFIENYVKLFKDPYFYRVLGNTLYYVLGVVPLNMIFSLLIAILLNQQIKGRGIFRTIYFLPVVTSIIAVSVVWKWLYHPRMGLINYLLSLVGIKPFMWLEEYRGIFTILAERMGFHIPSWMGGPSLALFSLTIMSVWKGLGYNVVIFLAGLQAIPQHYYEAAKIDGANAWQRFWNITIPLLSPTTFYVLIMTTIVSFQVFAPVWMMTGPPPGGPLGTTNVVVYYLYENAFNYLRYGYASAVAFVLFVIILALTIMQKKLEKKVHYE